MWRRGIEVWSGKSGGGREVSVQRCGGFGRSRENTNLHEWERIFANPHHSKGSRGFADIGVALPPNPRRNRPIGECAEELIEDDSVPGDQREQEETNASRSCITPCDY